MGQSGKDLKCFRLLKDTSKATKEIQVKLQKRLTNLENSCGGRDSEEIWEGHVHNAILKMDNQQGPTEQQMELCSML